MYLAELREAVKNILNRTDCTDAQATSFVNSGLARITSKARLSLMEMEFVYSNAANTNSFLLPSGVLQPIDLLVPAVLGSGGGYLGDYYSEVASDGQLALKKRDYRDIQAIPLGGPMSAYAIYRSTVYVRGQIPADTSVTFRYYGSFGALEEGFSNVFTAAWPDLCVYAALTFAVDVFVIPADRAASWENRYQSLLDDAKQQTWDMANEGGPAVISPTHES